MSTTEYVDQFQSYVVVGSRHFEKDLENQKKQLLVVRFLDSYYWYIRLYGW